MRNVIITLAVLGVLAWIDFRILSSVGVGLAIYVLMAVWADPRSLSAALCELEAHRRRRRGRRLWRLVWRMAVRLEFRARLLDYPKSRTDQFTVVSQAPQQLFAPENSALQRLLTPGARVYREARKLIIHRTGRFRRP